MDFGIGLLLIGGVIYLAYNSGAFAQFGIVPPAPLSPYANPGGLQANAQFSTPPLVSPGSPSAMGSIGNNQASGPNKTGLAITAGTSVGVAAVSAPSTFAALGLTGAAAGAAVAGIGAVVAIAAALWAAHLQRQKQAKDENSAMNLGIVGFDHDIQMVNAAYNARRISASDAISLVRQLFNNYWALVTPHIQPGRNGCVGGSACPPWPAKGSGCSGNIGAACCVGCYDLAGSDQAHVFSSTEGGDGATAFYYGAAGTIAALQVGGGVVLYQAVYPSKYGGKSRPAYKLAWSQISHG
jgi:type II secretory pathway pseudopilin PulG